MATSRRDFMLGALAAGAIGAMTNVQAEEGGQRGDVAWLKEVQTPPPKIPDDVPRLAPLLQDRGGQPITDLAGWERRRKELLADWNAFLQPLALDRPQPKLKVLEEDRPQGVIRQLVQYESEPGLPVEAYLLRPAELKQPVPGVVCLHSTANETIRQPAGVQGRPELAFGLRLAEQGMVAVCPRCFLWQGEGGYQELVRRFQRRHPRSLGMAKMLWDAIRAADVLQSLPEVDSKRLGAVGHSLGAKEALYLAAFDTRIAATVSSEGGIGTKFSNWDAVWYLGPGIAEPTFQREHHELLALVAPRPFLLIGGDSADGARSWPFIEAALGVYRLYGQPCRIGLYNHGAGHSVPPECEQRIYEWLRVYLQA